MSGTPNRAPTETLYLPVLIDDAWLVKLLTWNLPWIVSVTIWGAHPVVVLWRDE